MQSECDSISKEQIETATELAYAETISYNKENLERNFRTKADSITDSRAGLNGGRKKFNVNFIVKTGIFLYN